MKKPVNLIPILLLSFLGGSFILNSCGKGKNTVKKSSINWDEAITGIFHIEEYKWRAQSNKIFRILPSKENIDSFPNLAHSGVKEFFEFSQLLRTEDISMSDIDNYKNIRGFNHYYETIKNLDPYALQAKKNEILSELASSHNDYVDEYKKYRGTLFIIESGNLSFVSEKDYNFDNQVLNIPIETAYPQMPHGRESEAMGSPSVEIFDYFYKHGFGVEHSYRNSRKRFYRLPFSIDLAKRFFGSFKGNPGEREGSYIVKYWVLPDGVKMFIKTFQQRLLIPGMELKRVGFMFNAKDKFSVFLSDFIKNLKPDITIEE